MAELGRSPIILNEEQIKQVEILAGLGMEVHKIAQAIGISRATFFRLLKRDEDLRVAYDTGKVKAEAMIAKSLFDQARAGNMAAIIWIEKTRFGKREDLNLSTCLNYLTDMDIMPSDLAGDILEAYEQSEENFSQAMKEVFARYSRKERQRNA